MVHGVQITQSNHAEEKMISNKSNGCPARVPPVWHVVGSLCLAAFTLASSASAQTSYEGKAGGLNPLLPVVPTREPRPAEGAGKDQKLNRLRAGQDRMPVASFIDGLQANDAALEVVVGQARLLTLSDNIATSGGTAVVAVGDPSIVGFTILPNPRLIRLIGRRAGVTDLSITTAGGKTYAFEVHVVYDLPLMGAQLRQIFPDAYLKLGQIREHLIVEGQARSPAQVSHILQTLEAYLASVQVGHSRQRGGPGLRAGPRTAWSLRNEQSETDEDGQPPDAARQGAAEEEQREGAHDSDGYSGGAGGRVPPRIINLIRVPGVKQVLLQVRIAELDRTAMREIGADILGVDPKTGNIVGTAIGGGVINAFSSLGLGGLVGGATAASGTSTTAFGIFPSGDFEILLRALRKNSVLSILAEPNLVTMSGHEASFLAGGQFPVPVPQAGGGVSNNVTIEFKNFGVQLNFTPYVLDEGQIRLSVTPEVSTIDESLGTTLVVGGDPVPGLNTRRATTTVELREGQTLAMAGLLLVELDGRTSRIPGLGDLPYIGPLFSNTKHERVEKELVVMVTPFLVQPMNPEEVPCLPGDEITDPNDLEFYLLNRIEGRTGCPHRSTTNWDNLLCLVELMKLEKRCMSGPIGFSH